MALNDLPNIGDNIDKAADGIEKTASSAKDDTWGWAVVFIVAIAFIVVFFQERSITKLNGEIDKKDSIIEAKNNQLIKLSNSNILINDKAQKIDSSSKN